LLSELAQRITLLESFSIITDCEGPKDIKFLALAIDAAVPYLVSGDEKLLKLHPWRNVEILNPNQFLEKFQGSPRV
jgi:uncharacterized protein